MAAVGAVELRTWHDHLPALRGGLVIAHSVPLEVSLHLPICKEMVVEIAARMSSKGQLTVPKAVREALGIGEGDDVLFRVEGDRAVLARTPEFLSLAGTIAVPAATRNVAWDDIIRFTRASRVATRR